MKDVSIIIVSYNTKEMLSECLRSIRGKTEGVEYEVIVVDNASSDGTVEMLRREFPEVVLIETGSNLGFGKANNIGMDAADGKYMLLLNSDTLLMGNAVKDFYDKAESMKRNGRKIGVIGTILTGVDDQTCHSYGRFITPRTEIREVLAKYFRFLKSESNTRPAMIAGEKRVDYVTGADMFVPRSVYEDTGGFDPDFFMYCEEVDWQKRMEEKGLERIVTPTSGIKHLEGGSDKMKKKLWSPRRLGSLYKSRKIYRNKHYSKMILPLFRLAYFLLDMPSLILLTMLTKEKGYLKLINLK